MFYKHNGQFFIYGITSFGVVPKCSEDASVPGVYTKVETYLEWIEGIVWPNDVIL